MEIRGKILIEKTDFFSGYNLNEIRDWYLDLANEISKLAGIQATAPKLLRYYLNPKAQDHDETVIGFCKNEIEGRKKEEVPNYFGIYTNESAGTYTDLGEDYIDKIREHTMYKEIMEEMRDIFLGKQDSSKGIVSHIKKKGIKQEYELSYYQSCGFSPKEKIVDLLTIARKLRVDSSLSPLTQDKLDIYVGLNTFGIMARVIIVVNKINCDEIQLTEAINKQKIHSVNVSIKSWQNIIFDYYDFDANLGFPLPNPHYRTGRIHPEKEIIDFNELTHYHLVEMIKTSPPLANPFYIYKEFSESNPELLVKNKNIKY